MQTGKIAESVICPICNQIGWLYEFTTPHALLRRRGSAGYVLHCHDGVARTCRLNRQQIEKLEDKP